MTTIIEKNEQVIRDRENNKITLFNQKKKEDKLSINWPSKQKKTHLYKRVQNTQTTFKASIEQHYI